MFESFVGPLLDAWIYLLPLLVFGGVYVGARRRAQRRNLAVLKEAEETGMTESINKYSARIIRTVAWVADPASPPARNRRDMRSLA